MCVLKVHFSRSKFQFNWFPVQHKGRLRRKTTGRVVTNEVGAIQFAISEETLEDILGQIGNAVFFEAVILAHFGIRFEVFVTSRLVIIELGTTSRFVDRQREFHIPGKPLGGFLVTRGSVTSKDDANCGKYEHTNKKTRHVSKLE